VLAYQDLHTHAGDLPADRPLWPPPPDPFVRSLPPIPPMTRLIRLGITFDRNLDIRECSYLLPSYNDPRGAVAQVCWIAQSNPHLEELKLDSITIKDDRDVSLLTTTIFGLSGLRKLSVDVVCSTYLAWTLADTFFFSCPSLIEVLRIDTSSNDDEDEDEDEDDDDEWDVPRRQEPSMGLKDLHIWQLNVRDWDETLRSVFEHCPIIEVLGGPLVDGIFPDVASHVARIIVELCPKIRNLVCRIPYERFLQGTLSLMIMQDLPKQQRRVLDCPHSEVFSANFDNGIDISNMFRRHSSTLTTFSLSFDTDFDSSTVETILGECGGLETFIAHGMFGEEGLQIDLDDAIRRRWACTGIRRLALTTTVKDSDVIGNTVHSQHFYRSSCLSEEKTRALARLERLYIQLGALTELEFLDLRLESLHWESRHWPCGRSTTLDSFPRMLQLADEKRSVLGYLQLFAGLINSATLDQQVPIDVAETGGVFESNTQSDELPDIRAPDETDSDSPIDLYHAPNTDRVIVTRSDKLQRHF
ncbi:hypothetical protein BGX29_000106, partial [Mortierella sp. GBA35]